MDSIELLRAHHFVSVTNNPNILEKSGYRAVVSSSGITTIFKVTPTTNRMLAGINYNQEELLAYLKKYHVWS